MNIMLQLVRFDQLIVFDFDSLCHVTHITVTVMCYSNSLIINMIDYCIMIHLGFMNDILICWLKCTPTQWAPLMRIFPISQ